MGLRIGRGPATGERFHSASSVSSPAQARESSTPAPRPKAAKVSPKPGAGIPALPSPGSPRRPLRSSLPRFLPPLSGHNHSQRENVCLAWKTRSGNELIFTCASPKARSALTAYHALGSPALKSLSGLRRGCPLLYLTILPFFLPPHQRAATGSGKPRGVSAQPPSPPPRGGCVDARSWAPRRISSWHWGTLFQKTWAEWRRGY